MWLKNRWTEKDYLLEHFVRHGAYPEGDPVKAMNTEAALLKLGKALGNGETKKVIHPIVKTAKFITTEVKAGGMEEFLAIFAPISAAATALSSGQLSPENIDFDALLNKVAQSQQMNLAKIGAAPKATQSQEMLREALIRGSKAKAQGKQIPGSAIDKITKNAALQQREMLEAMSKGNLPKTSTTGGPTAAGKKLDPAVQNIIDNVDESTRQRLLKTVMGAAPTKGTRPDVRKALPMAPMQAIVTRPITTIAMQRATQAAAGMAAAKKAQPKVAPKTNDVAGKKVVAAKNPAGAKGGSDKIVASKGKVASGQKQMNGTTVAKGAPVVKKTTK